MKCKRKLLLSFLLAGLVIPILTSCHIVRNDIDIDDGTLPDIEKPIEPDTGEVPEIKSDIKLNICQVTDTTINYYVDLFVEGIENPIAIVNLFDSTNNKLIAQIENNSGTFTNLNPSTSYLCRADYSYINPITNIKKFIYSKQSVTTQKKIEEVNPIYVTNEFNLEKVWYTHEDFRKIEFNINDETIVNDLFINNDLVITTDSPLLRIDRNLIYREDHVTEQLVHVFVKYHTEVTTLSIYLLKEDEYTYQRIVTANEKITNDYEIGDTREMTFYSPINQSSLIFITNNDNFSVVDNKFVEAKKYGSSLILIKLGKTFDTLYLHCVKKYNTPTSYKNALNDFLKTRNSTKYYTIDTLILETTTNDIVFYDGNDIFYTKNLFDAFNKKLNRVLITFRFNIYNIHPSSVIILDPSIKISDTNKIIEYTEQPINVDLDYLDKLEIKCRNFKIEGATYDDYFKVKLVNINNVKVLQKHCLYGQYRFNFYASNVDMNGYVNTMGNISGYMIFHNDGALDRYTLIVTNFEETSKLVAPTTATLNLPSTLKVGEIFNPLRYVTPSPDNSYYILDLGSFPEINYVAKYHYQINVAGKYSFEIVDPILNINYLWNVEVIE